jgi:dihydroneopterin aldolase
VADEERRVGQRYRVTVELERDLRRAGETDEIEDTVHYGKVCDAVRDVLREKEFKLIENAAQRVAGTLLARFEVQAVTVCLEKLLPPIDGVVVASAGVRIRRVKS